jgi:hypothetical protein
MRDETTTQAIERLDAIAAELRELRQLEQPDDAAVARSRGTRCETPCKYVCGRPSRRATFQC